MKKTNTSQLISHRHDQTWKILKLWVKKKNCVCLGVIFPSILKCLRQCDVSDKWNWAWQPWLPQVSSVVTAPSPGSCQPHLELGHPGSLQGWTGQMHPCLGLADSQRKDADGRNSQLCSSCGLAACTSEYDFKWTSRNSELFGQNSLKMAYFSYSHSGLFTPASLFTWKIPENNNSWLQWNRIRPGQSELQNYWVIWDLLECKLR